MPENQAIPTDEQELYYTKFEFGTADVLIRSQSGNEVRSDIFRGVEDFAILEGKNEFGRGISMIGHMPLRYTDRANIERVAFPRLSPALDIQVEFISSDDRHIRSIEERINPSAVDEFGIFRDNTIVPDSYYSRRIQFNRELGNITILGTKLRSEARI